MNSHGARPSSRFFHVFPTGRMCSMKGVMLMWVVPVFLAVGAVSAAFSYWSHSAMVREFMDSQMEQLGGLVAIQQGNLLPPAPTTERVEKWGAYVVQVYDGNRRLQLSPWPQLSTTLQEQSGFSDVRVDGKKWRVYTTHPVTTGGRTVQVFQSDMFRAQLAAKRAGAALAPVMILLPLAIMVLWGVSGAMSRAVEDIGRKVAEQDVDSITELPLDRVPHELKPMVASFNGLLTRMRDSSTEKRRFVQDAAHELRTPLTAIRVQLENVRRDLPDGASTQSFSQLESGVKRAQLLLDQLLKLARQQAPATDPTRTVDLHGQLRESIAAMIALADQRNIDLGLVGEPNGAALTLRCAPSDLRSLLDSLIENALRYTPEGGVVDVRLLNSGGKPAIEVVDSGPGIPEELLPQVFDRFFRVPGSNVHGSGLGLAIARAAAQRCGLRISLRNREDRSGLIAHIEPA
jgi:two-component system, OmpR family, sensor kinase